MKQVLSDLLSALMVGVNFGLWMENTSAGIMAFSIIIFLVEQRELLTGKRRD